MRHRKLNRSEWKEIRVRYLESVGLRLQGRTWAVSQDGGWVCIPVADERSPGRWFTGFNHDRFESRRALGVIVLCWTREGEVLDFGLGRELIGELDEFLQSTSARGAREIRINIRREGSRYLLLLNKREPLDITGRLGALEWVGKALEGIAEEAVEYGRPDSARGGRVRRFFARCRSGKLEPMEGGGELEDGVYLVEAREVERAPATVGLRRIAALGAGRLPEDLADKHDLYRQGGPKK